MSGDIAIFIKFIENVNDIQEKHKWAEHEIAYYSDIVNPRVLEAEEIEDDKEIGKYSFYIRAKQEDRRVVWAWEFGCDWVFEVEE